jgi:hypothetical protein
MRKFDRVAKVQPAGLRRASTGPATAGVSLTSLRRNLAAALRGLPADLPGH